MSYEPLLLSEEQEWFGEWWLPDNPEDKRLFIIEGVVGV